MIVKEGLIFILIGVVATAGFLFTSLKFDSKLLFTIAVILGVMSLFTIFFFRDPDRKIPNGENLLLSPADGKVIGIEEIEDDYIGTTALKISIFLSIFDVHINRIPLNGVVDFVKYNPGKFFSAFKDKSSDLNEQNQIGIIANNGRKIIVKQIAGLIARRIVCKINEGDMLRAGEKFGLIRFGSRTELIIPADSKLEIKLGQHVFGGKTIIGFLPDSVPSMSDKIEE